jgi:thiol-disulfide isomerase/thioredoxin
LFGRKLPNFIISHFLLIFDPIMATCAFFNLQGVDISTDAAISFGELRKQRAEGKLLVVDFWHTKCTRCPAALEKLNEEAEELHDDIVVVACAISQGEGNFDVVKDVIG